MNSTTVDQLRTSEAASDPKRNDCENRIYRNKGNPLLLELANLGRRGVALDVGCGAGDNARILTSMGWQVSGVTLSQTEQAAAESICSRVWIHDLDQGLPEESTGPFDLVVLSHVLEHLRSPEILITQIGRVMAPDGQIAVALPNVLNWHQRLLFLAGRFEYFDEGIMDSTHLRFYTFSSARRMLQRGGLRVIQAKGAGSVLPWGPLRTVVPWLTSSIDRFFCWMMPGLFGRQLLYIAVLR